MQLTLKMRNMKTASYDEMHSAIAPKEAMEMGDS